MKRDLPSECGGCGLEEPWLLHHVCVRHTYSRLCTSCVLKLHSGSFCPICFEVYEGSKLPANRVMCMRCPSVTHPDCVSQDLVSSFVCPPCSNPNFTFFESSGGSDGDLGHIDEKMAKVLVAAAKIAWISMNKAASVMRMESDRKVKDAAVKRKEARQSLERLCALVAKEKKGKEIMAVERILAPVAMTEQKKNSKGNNALYAMVVAQQRFENPTPLNVLPPVGNRNRVEGSSVAAVENQQLQNPSIANEKNSSYLPQVQINNVYQEKDRNGLFSIPTGPDSEGQGNSKGRTNSDMGRQIPQPNQVVRSDSLVKNSNEGVQLVSSNAAS